MKTLLNLMLFWSVLTTCSAQSSGLLLNGTTLTRPGPKIVGGRNAREGEIPYQLRLEFDGGGLCGASLIRVGNKQAVITAAHCLTEYLGTINPRPSRIQIFGGSIYISGGNNTQRRRASKVVTHGFNDTTFENDIAILSLDRRFRLNRYVNVINLPRLRQYTDGVATGSGWGQISFGGQTSPTLKMVDLPIVPNGECGRAYLKSVPPIRIVRRMLCAGVMGRGGKDTCGGDSGGPLRSKELNYLAGVTSFGLGCGHRSFPGVYTKVSFYVDWIKRTVEAF